MSTLPANQEPFTFLPKRGSAYLADPGWPHPSLVRAQDPKSLHPK